MRPKILQGTDGIRGEVRLSTNLGVSNLSPVDAFCEKGIITDTFMELYIYSHINSMIKTGKMKEGDKVVIGWDPRDKEKHFTDAAITGALKAGVTVLNIGIVPTPLVPLFMLSENAASGIMITASHNPYNQNGIKIFLPPFGLKMLTDDDAHLSAEVCKEKILPASIKGELIECRSKALKLFEEYLLDERNSWVSDKIILSNLIVIVDCANGSYSTLTSDILKKSGVRQVIELNNDLTNGMVNEECGVVDFENISFITSEMVHNSTGRFSNHLAVLKLFEIGRENKTKIKSGSVRVSAAIFDADGDRFYRLDYNPLNDTVLVQNGDIIAYHQARYLISTNENAYKNAIYVNTIDSDLETSCEASRLGLQTKLTAVGDKWVLWWTVITLLKSILSLCEKDPKATGEPAKHICLLKKEVNELEFIETDRSEKLYAITDKIKSLKTTDMIFNEILKTAEKSLSYPGNIKFTVGSESSGHTITFGYLPKKDGSVIPIFSGNGLKSAINSFVATESLYKYEAPNNYFSSLHRPFPGGLSKSCYLFFTNKSLLQKGTSLWNGLSFLIKKEIENRFNTLDICEEQFSDDPALLYVSIKNSSGQMRAGVYVRNSGTEDKTSVNIKGAFDDEKQLNCIMTAAIKYLLLNMKDQQKEQVILENNILSDIYQKGTVPIENFSLDIPKDQIKRFCKIMETKEGLIEQSTNGYQLTTLGEWYIETAC